MSVPPRLPWLHIGKLAALAVLVAGHDVPFLREPGLTRWLRLDGGLTEVDPL
jgi:hypothetical protein